MKKTKRIVSTLLVVAVLMVVVIPIQPVYAGRDDCSIEKIILGLIILKAIFSPERTTAYTWSIKISPQRVLDPTLGRIENKTDIWTIEILIDVVGDEKEVGNDKIIIPPGQVRLIHLDIGEHIVQAWAYVDTIYGRRLVGIYNEEGEPNLVVDGKMLRGKNYGWKLWLRERNFDFPD